MFAASPRHMKHRLLLLALSGLLMKKAVNLTSKLPLSSPRISIQTHPNNINKNNNNNNNTNRLIQNGHLRLPI